jgi:signal transduction histidine kinase
VSQLLENACKYSKPGSMVNIQIEEQSEQVTIRVSNTGSSISAADQFRIFERFYRGVDASQLSPGSGLGL